MKNIVLRLLYSTIIRNLLRIIFGVHYTNREILDSCEQYILVANHNSHLDTVALMAALPAHQLIRTKPVAASDYFGSTGVKKRLTEFFVNALLIPRSSPKAGDTFANPIDLMVDAIDNRYSLILFPEGTRGEAGKLQKFKKGIGLVIAKRPHIPFIPVYLKGMGKLLPKGEKILIPFDSYVRFGKPVYCQEKTVEEIVAEVEKEILALSVD